MSTEELLKPRYKVIADYPNSTWGVGVVIELHPTDNRHPFYGNLHNYPHLFKPLQWWEEREEKDMPVFVKSISTALRMKIGEVSKVKAWTKDIGKTGVWLEGKPFSRLIETLVPSTEQEYENWLQLQEDLKNESDDRMAGLR